MKKSINIFLTLILVVFIASAVILPFYFINVYLFNKKVGIDEVVVYTNVEGKGKIDSANHFFWESRDKVFFKDNSNNNCYIAQKTATHKMIKEKVEYTTSFKILPEECGEVKFVLGNGNYFYTLMDNRINIYVLNSNKSMKYWISNYKIYGIKNNKIYLKRNKKDYETDLEFTNEIRVDSLPDSFDYRPEEFDYTYDTSKK